MDVGIDIDFGKLPGINARIAKGEPVKAGMPVGAEYLRSRLAYYPNIRRQKQKPKTRKQQIYLIIAYKKGEIVSPYPRSGRMAKAWKVEAKDGGQTFTITNKTAAAYYTKHPQGQARYHKGNWPNTDDDIKRYGPEAVKRTYDATVKNIEGR